MNTDVWDWLPDGALTSLAVMSVIDGALEDWNHRWFRSWRLVRQRLEFPAAPSGEPLVAAGASLLVRASAENAGAIAARALDLDLARLELTKNDQAVLDDFCGRVIQDLVRTLEAAFGVDGAPTGNASGPVALVLRDQDGRKMLMIETTRAVLAQTRRQTFIPKPSRPSPLLGIEAALTEVSVTVQARLGSSFVSLPDARRLTAGDIIVLDRALDAPFDLAGPGGTTIACATLVDTASPRSLRLQAAPRRQR